jgi:hypothetical protein
LNIHQLQIKLTSQAPTNEHLPANKRKANSTLASKKQAKSIKTSLSSTYTPCHQLIAYHLFNSKKLLKSRSLNVAGLSTHVLAMINQLGEVFEVLSSHLNRWHSKETNDATIVDPKEDTKSFINSFALALDILTEIPLCHKDDVDLGGVLYGCTMLYLKILNALSYVSLHGNLASTDTPTASSKSSTTPRNGLLISLKNLAIDLLRYLDLQSPIHFRIFEGFEYLIIERTGDLIYQTSFNHPRTGSIDLEIEADQATFGSQDQNAYTKATTKEAKQILPILKEILILAPQFYSIHSTERKLYLSRSSLSRDEKRRLQETLVRCVWNEDRGSKIMKPLLGPVSSTKASTEGVGKKVDKEGSFVEEVWKLIGWEVLSFCEKE